MHSRIRRGTGLAVVLLVAQGYGGASPAHRLPPGEAAHARLHEAYGRLPLRFEPGEGGARYVSHGPGYSMSVRPTEMVLSLHRGSPLRVKLARSAAAEVQGLEELPGKANYFIGSDPSRWRTGVAGYARLRCRGVYPGIDLEYYGNRNELEYDFVVAPGADPTRIRLGFEGARGLRVDGEGNLAVSLDGGEVLNHAPQVYQEEGAVKRRVQGRWILHAEDEAGFELEAYDPGQVLVIDPVLSYSTFLGGTSAGTGYAIAVDDQGSAYVTGFTDADDFPTQNPFQEALSGRNAFVTKLSPSGTSLVYSTYLGGNGSIESGMDIAVDAAGSAYVIGHTDSSDFPTKDPIQPDQPGLDAFVTKLSPSGNSLVYSTYLGGNDPLFESGEGIAVDAAGSAYITGGTTSSDFPLQNPFQAQLAGFFDAFVAKLSPSGTSLVYSTYLGGNGGAESGTGIALDAQGSAYVIGYTDATDFPTQNPFQTHQGSYDAFVTKLSPDGTSLLYSTYLGGGSPPFGTDQGNSIAVDSSGSAYVTGYTSSADFPTLNPLQTHQPNYDAFVTKLSPSGNTLVYSTFLGGSNGDFEAGWGIAVDAQGSATVVGITDATDFPTREPLQTDQPLRDAFVAKLSPSGTSLVYSTYLGGSDPHEEGAYAVTVDAAGDAYVTGPSSSPDFPVLNPYQPRPRFIFVTKLSITPPPSSPSDFHTLTPCRLLDTRNDPGAFGGPALVVRSPRIFLLAGRCGLPATARAISVNLAVTGSSAPGNLRLYKAGSLVPVASSISYGAGQTRSNNAIVELGPSGALSVQCFQASGTAHFILDVNGYFE